MKNRLKEALSILFHGKHPELNITGTNDPGAARAVELEKQELQQIEAKWNEYWGS